MNRFESVFIEVGARISLKWRSMETITFLIDASKYTYGQAEFERATRYRPGGRGDPTIMEIEREYSLPGSNPALEDEALYEYRNGLRAGLAFDWGRQSGFRSAKDK